MPEIIQLSDYERKRKLPLVKEECEIIPRTELVLRRMQKQYNGLLISYIKLFNPWI